MAAMTAPIGSDPTLLAEVRRYGEFDTNACYQCGSCTLSCELVTGSLSFPRRNIRYALLGLRVPLLGSLEPWICQDCGDCSPLCPRGAEPRASMATLRRFLRAQYDWTSMSSRLIRSKAWHHGTLAVVALLTLLLIVAYHLYYVALDARDLTTALGQEHMFPTMTYYTRTVVILPLLLLISQAGRMAWFAMRRAPHIPLSAYFVEARTYLFHATTQALMRKCGDTSRWKSHWPLTVGVVAMLVIKVVALKWFQTERILPLFHPQRWVGYVATAFILFGAGQILIGRIRARKEFFRERHFEDFVFPLMLLLTALSGIAVHVFRYAGFELTCHYLYALHVIIATPMLLVEIPFGDWSHMIYRPLAAYLQAVRERAERRAPREGVMSHAA